MKAKESRVFLLLGTFFIANALIAEFIGVKIFSLEKVFGYEPLNMTLFGVKKLSMNLTAGVLLWPIVFVLTDVINEYYGKKGVRLLSYIAVGLIAWSFILVYGAMKLTPSDFWIFRETDSGIVNMDIAFNTIFGQGLWIIVGSIIAFLIAQIIDVTIFHRIKKYTGEKLIWLRATGSTLVSQFIDSFVVLFIAFYIGADWSLKTVLAIGVVNYIYKFFMAIILIPLIYLAHGIIDKYLGEELARQMKQKATAD
ncbi:MAG: queuosine precursor transporter [Bacteroidetes bacterium]|nr:queuosine precursor transporter [Bacteroidota bacterium]